MNTRADIILACRCELPANLERTCANIIATKGKQDQLTILFDGPHDHLRYKLPVEPVKPFATPRGPGQVRHWQIERTDAEFIFMVDGHMTFPPGWVDAAIEHVSQNPRDITCCHLRGLDYSWQPEPGQKIYDGCDMVLLDPLPARRNWWLNCIWRKTPLASGEVSGLMGACYCLRRDWYFQIGSPLAIFEAWGGDEEILSVATWMMGGRVWLLPVTCGHIWAAPRARPEAADADRQGNRKDILPNEWLAMWANHYAMLAAIPMPESDRARFERHLDQGNHRNERIRELLAPRRPAIDHLRSVLEMAPVTWYNLIETKRIMEVKGGIMQKKKTADQTETAAIQPDSSASPDTPPRPVCRRCGGTSFSKGRTRNYHPRCLKCGWIYNG